MDVDESQISLLEPVELVSYFELSQERFAWNETRVDDIQMRRHAMSGQLFFDILLSLGGVEDPTELYPPAGTAELKRLLEAIENLSFDSMKRDCVVYYLLKWQGDGREKGYAQKNCISPHYVALADAYWHLDSGVDTGKAVALLSDARIVKEYSSKVIETLSMDDRPGTLVLRYVKTCNPALKERNDLQKYVRALAEHNFVEAWQYQRTYPLYDDTRKFLIREVLNWALNPMLRQEALTQLLSLPMNRFEEEVVREFAIHPPEMLMTISTAVIRDLVCVRLIQSCRYIEAVKFDRQYPSTAEFAGATTKGTWQTERKRIMEQVLSIMPAAERAQLDRELEQIASSSSHDSKTSGSKMSGSGSGSWMHVGNGSTSDISMSWEDVGNRSSFMGLREDTTSAALQGRMRATRGKRVSLLNGRLPPSASGTPTPRNQPLSAHPTALSQATTVPASSPGNSILIPNAIETSTPPKPISARPPLRVPVPNATGSATGTAINGINGSTPKTNAFMARNAFYQPPTTAENLTPTANGISRSSAQRRNNEAKNNEANRSLGPNTSQATVIVDEDDEIHANGLVADTSISAARPKKDVAKTDHEIVDSDVEDLGYSMFSRPAHGTRKAEPAATPRSPRRLRNTASTASSASLEGNETLPGAFVEDESEVQKNRPSTRSTTTKSKESSRRKVSAMNAPKKRPTPDDGFTPSIPGGLMDEDYGLVDAHENAAHTYSEEEEEEDLVPPLPSQQTRSRARKGKSNASTTGRTLKPRRSSSVASTASAVTTDTDGEGSGTRMVRRSSRLSNVSTSPNEKKSASVGSSRPRKSTRTSGAGATATGKGATKRR